MTAAADELNAAMEAATGASLPYMDFRVVLEDGREFFTHADQRDIRRATVHIHDPEADTLGFSAATAWAYLTRTDQLHMGWAEFEAAAAWVLPLEEQTTADPTPPATAG